VAVAFATEGDSVGRYTMPFVAPGIIVFCAYAVRWTTFVPHRPVWVWACLLFCAFWVSVEGVHYGIGNYAYRASLMDLGLPPASYDPLTTGLARLNPEKEKRQLAALQKSVPPGEPILEHLYVSYALDFNRNPIFVADYPGLAGLPPGMPIGRGPDPLRQYLLKNSIRFVALTYGRGQVADLTSTLSLQQLLTDPAVAGKYFWPYLQNKVSVDVQANLNLLAKQQATTYDDGQACVIDLKTPASHRPRFS
jgi:hypothetical protein